MSMNSRYKRRYNDRNEDGSNNEGEHYGIFSKRPRFSNHSTSCQYEYPYAKVRNFAIGLRNINAQETDNNIDEKDSIITKLLHPSLNIKSFLNDVMSDETDLIMKFMTLTIEAGQITFEKMRFKTYCNVIIGSNFIKNEFDKFLMKILTEFTNIDSIRIILQFIKIMYENRRQSAYTLFYHKTKLIISIINTHSDLSPEILQLINDIKELGFLNDPYNENLEIIEYDLCPSDEFRQMSICPTEDELLNIEYCTPVLRCNKVSGAYESVNDYLDIQFRLMREDFIHPLRQGLTQYIHNTHKKISEIRIYKNVQILHCWPCHRNGIVYYLQLNNPKLKTINWAESKRFLYGSFVCLSHDNFQTLFFASIVERDKKTLSKGLLLVKFENSNFDRSKRYVMLESTNLFESYKHVLRKLQNTNENNLPMKEYIVYGKSEVTLPEYLLNNLNMEYKIDDQIFHPGLEAPGWPTAADLKMDESQFRAFKSALTRKLTIIQGPPGTGKTFLGLKICETLIKSVQKSDPNFGPILVVCFTNHALDQFLEEIDKENITKNIIRIGTRSKSEILEKYQLHNIKKKERYTPESRIKCLQDERKCSLEFLNLQAKRNLTECYLIHLNILKFFMNENHFCYFEKVNMHEWLMGKCLPQEEKWIENWLENIIVVEIRNQVKIIVKEAFKNFKMREVDEMNFDNDSDLEGNYINNQRIIDENDSDKKSLRSEMKRIMKLMKNELCANDDNVGTSLHEQFKKYLNKITKRLFQSKLQSNECMSKEETEKLISLSTLTINDRWKLYRYWRNEFVKINDENLQSLEKDYDFITEELRNINFREDRKIMKNKNIIGMTTTGAARYETVLARLNCKIIIIEEAAEVLESHVIASLSKGCEHLILIGDHKQLKPKPASFDLTKKYQLDLSLFERLINNNLPFNVLQLQHRMRPEIANLMKNIYENLENHESVLNYPNIPGIADNLFFLDHKEPEVLKEEITSYSNQFEAEFIMGFCRRLLDNGIANSKVTILTLYTGQMSLLRKMMYDNHIQNIRICVVDNYQGEENDVILLSLVRSNEEEKIGFVKTENRICVSLSRARHGLFVFGNFTILSKQSGLWRKMCKDLKEKKLLDNKMILTCQYHSFKRLEIFNPRDFKKYPGGGCDGICNANLPCEHTCKATCHLDDRDHIKRKCHEKCMKKCDNGHNCKLQCWENCRPCTVLVLKTIPICNHSQSMACYAIPSSKMCSANCERKFLCGHKCQKRCSQDCGQCIFQVTENCPECGFKIRRKCSDSSICQRLCRKKLPCGHECGGNCYTCNNQRLHIPCNKPSTTHLICGHLKRNLCFKQSNYCDSFCEQSCLHNRCKNQCGERCVDCLEDCLWRCDHFRCTNHCYQYCNRPICDAKCTKSINCNVCCLKFQCYGICGEICRNMCPRCDSRIKELFHKHGSKVKIITFLTCGHSFECNEIDRYMNASYEKEKIEMKRCPTCKKLITVESCFRYSNIVKRIFLDVKRVQNIFTDGIQLNHFEDFLSLYLEKRAMLYEMFSEFKVVNVFSEIESNQSRKLTNIETRKCFISFNLIFDIYKYFFQSITNENELTNYEYIKKSISYLLTWLGPFKRSFESFELDQFYSEFDRIHLIIQLSSERIHQLLPNDAPNMIKELQMILNDNGKTVTEFVDKISSCIIKNNNDLRDKLDLNSYRNINEITGIVVSRGDWHRCRKGHYYIKEWSSKLVQCQKCNVSTTALRKQIEENIA